MPKKTKAYSIPCVAIDKPFEFVRDWMVDRPESSLQLATFIDIPASTIRNIRNGTSRDVNMATWLTVVRRDLR